MQNKRLTNIRQNINSVTKRLFGLGVTPEYGFVDHMSGPQKDIKILGKYSGLAFACINAIAEDIGNYEPYLYSIANDGSKQAVNNHPFLALLESPNPDISKYQLFEGGANFDEQFGEFFWYMVPGSLTGYGRGVKEIYLLRPDRITINVDKTSGDVIGYTYSTGVGNNTIPFSAEEIVHHMRFNPRDAYRGMGTVEAAFDYIVTEEEVSRFTRNYFKNNAAMSGVLKVNGKVSRESWNKFVRQWRERYEGPENAGKVALVRDTDVEFTPIQLSMNEMQLTDLKKSTIDQILMMFRIPKGILGMESDQGLGRASVETLEYIFAKRTIEPKLRRLDKTLQRALDRYYPNSGLHVGHKNMIPADKEYQLSYYNQAVDRWLTRDEIRDQEPDIAIGDIKGGDQLYVPINMIPIGEAIDPIADDPTKSQKIKLIKAGTKKVAPKYDTAQKEAFRLELEKNWTKYWALYGKAFKKVIKAQEARVMSSISSLGKSQKGIADSLLNLSHESAEFTKALQPVLVDIYKTQGNIALAFAGKEKNKDATDGGFDVNGAVLNAIMNSTKRMAKNFDDQTLEELNKTLAEGVQAGEGLDKLSSRVADVYDMAKNYRTERVARTESINASNDATRQAYIQTDYVTAMEWFANPSACEFCLELDGTQVGLEDNFVSNGDSVEGASGATYLSDYRDVDTPPLHPNCSCTIIPVTVEAKALNRPNVVKGEAVVNEPVLEDLSGYTVVEQKTLDEQASYIKALEDIAGIKDAE